MNRESAKLEGWEDLDKALAELPRSVQRGVLTRVARKALEPMRDEAERLAPDDPTTPAPYNLKTSIKIGTRAKFDRFRRVPKENEAEVHMGPTSDGYPQAMVMEFGAAPHFVTKGAGRRGKAKRIAQFAEREGHTMHPGVKPQPYMRPAWDKYSRGLVEVVGKLLWAEIAKTAERHARRAAKRAAQNKG